MYSKNLFSIILIRIILITLSSFAFVLAVPHLHKEYYFSLIGIGILIAYQIYLLANYLNKTNQALAHFFNSVRYEEPNLVFPQGQNNKILDSLGYSLNELNNSITKMRMQNAKQNLFLNNLVEHVGIGLISYNSKGEVDILNNATKELLHIKGLNNLNDLKTKLPEVYNCISSLTPGKQQLVKVLSNKLALYLSLKLSIIKSEKPASPAGRETINLISIQDIKTELEQKELDSWQKLIRVLTHEISNSISPIASLANTTKKYFASEEFKPIIKEQKGDLIQKATNNLDTIENTGKGLVDFVGGYRRLTALPHPKFEQFLIKKLFDKLVILVEEFPNARNAQVEFKQTPANITITADFNLLEKVLINLITNSLHATEKVNNAKISINAYKNIENRVVISVKDNGKGIPSEIMDDIFIPFYTTKDKGSGIGLSLSKQILRLHNASITANSTPNKETEFIIVF